MILGKLAGALLGYLLIGGLLGIAVGALFGHLFDRVRALGQRARGARRPGLGAGLGAGVGRAAGRGAGPGIGLGTGRAPAADLVEVQRAFFDATFGVLGHVAKADGRVDPSEIRLAEALMARMHLDAARRREAIRLFEAGKAPDFALADAVGRLAAAAPGQANLFFTFLQIQMQMALADGEYDPAEERVLREVASLLGVPGFVFRQIEAIARMSARAAAEGFGPGGAGAAGGRGGLGGRGGDRGGDRGGARGGRAGGARSGTGGPSLEEAYAVLGVEPGADRATVKGAWRRQMSEHHPDKLASRGLPEEMMELANERAQGVQRAWERIREARGWR